MTKKLIKLSIAMILLMGLFGASLKTRAYPAYLRAAAKFGAKDCLFCHKMPEGGEGWNERGQWLIAEKDRRKADAVEIEWLADYKPAEKSAEKKEGESADKSEKKEGEKEEPKKKDKP